MGSVLPARNRTRGLSLVDCEGDSTRAPEQRKVCCRVSECWHLRQRRMAVGELSGGQKQWVCIARALAPAPEFVICDKVTSAPDHLVAEEVLKLLDRRQCEYDLSYTFITHDIGTVCAIADEVLVMFQGKVVESGPKAEMFVPPHHEYPDLLLASVAEMDPDRLYNLLNGRILDAAGMRSGTGDAPS